MALPAVLLGLVPNIIKDGIALLDRKFPSQAEKDKAIRQYESDTQDKLQGAWDEEQKQVTKRHEADMHSDSWLSKNIRPLVLIYLIILFTVAFFIEVPHSVFELLRDLLMTSFVFYFGSRTLEKMTNKYTNMKGK